MSVIDLDRWVPIGVYHDARGPMVDWCHVGDERLDDPFFEQTIDRLLRRPADLLFRHQTPIDELTELASVRPSVSPAGFVFHMSRCGSTLVARMLGTDPSHIVISEAEPIDAVLRSNLRDPSITDDDRVEWLRGLVAALGRPRHGERRLFVKFDSWSIVDLPIVERAFPGVPWVFLVRNPVEVLVSHARERGSQTLPGVLEPALLGLEPAELGRMSLDEYGAAVLGRICEAAVRHHDVGRGRVVDFADLPAAFDGEIARHFGVSLPAERLRPVTEVHAKRPDEGFSDDRVAKQAAASESIRELADRWVAAPYAQLERLRSDQRAVVTADRSRA